MDNSRGYLLDNCVSCCWDCNRAKGSMPYDEFINYINRLVLFRSRFCTEEDIVYDATQSLIYMDMRKSFDGED